MGVVQIRVTPKTRNPFTIKALSISGVTWNWHVLNHALFTMWLVAAVRELDAPMIKVDQQVKVAGGGLPGREFDAWITTVGAGLDPATCRLTVRAEVQDPEHLLKPEIVCHLPHRGGRGTARRRRAGQRAHLPRRRGERLGGAGQQPLH